MNPGRVRTVDPAHAMESALNYARRPNLRDCVTALTHARCRPGGAHKERCNSDRQADSRARP